MWGDRVNDACLITEHMIAEEFRFQMRRAGFPTNEPRITRRYDQAQMALVYFVQCGEYFSDLRITYADLALSLDDFSCRHVLPVIAHMRYTRTLRNGASLASKVRTLSYRVPLLVRMGNRGFTFSISGWNGAV